MSNEFLTEMSEGAIFSRVLEQERALMSPEVARVIIALDFSHEDRDWINKLSAKARKRDLTAEEDQALDNLIRVGDLLAIMQSKARRSLQDDRTTIR